MRASRRAVEASARRIESASTYACQALSTGRVEHEPEFTDRLLARIESELDGASIGGLFWSAKTLTSRGHGSQERRFGADFVGVLDIDVEEQRTRKGFLAQAKRLEPTSGLGPSEFDRLRDQCDQMLAVTPDSFVFLYSRAAVTIVPAIAIASVPPPVTFSPYDVYSRSVSSFFELHIECFIGDRSISSIGDDFLSLPAILDRTAASRGIELTARTASHR